MSRILFAFLATPTTPSYTPPTSLTAYWGPHFPDVSGGHYWSKHFPDGLRSGSVFDPYGPPGVATFALRLEIGFTLTLSWASGICDHRDGTEQRIATLTRPKQTYKGSAKLSAAPTRLMRSRLARYAAQGAAFLLGLPHEALPLIADATGSTLVVPSAALARWDAASIGQRVVVVSADGTQSIDAVIQDIGAGTIPLDVAPGAIGNEGGLVMPAMAVYLDPQQGFDRYRTAVEVFGLTARAAIFDFAPPRAQLDLEAVTGNAAFAGAFITWRTPGLFGDGFVNFSPSGAASLSESGPITTIFFQNGVTTLGAVATLLDTSANAKLTGTYNAAAILHSGDSFGSAITGTTSQGAMGTGAALTMYAGHPVWDRPIENPDTISDPSHALTELVDLGGVPVAIGHADEPIWGRTVAMTSTEPTEWQWLKLMLATVRGQQRMFWLPTWRPDFTFVSAAGTALVVRTDDDSDITAWWPAQRDRLQLAMGDGTVQYVQIMSRVDHGDGTQTLTLSDAVTSTAIAMVSWLEAARFEQDDFEIQWGEGWRFSISVQARAHAAASGELAEVDA